MNDNEWKFKFLNNFSLLITFFSSFFHSTPQPKLFVSNLPSTGALFTHVYKIYTKALLCHCTANHLQLEPFDDLCAVKKCKKMSGKILRNLFFTRNGAYNLNSRHVSSFKGNFGSNRTNLTKWYWLLSGTGAAIGYFAIKSFKNSTQVYALQQRKVRRNDWCHRSKVHILIFRMSLLRRQ